MDYGVRGLEDTIENLKNNNLKIIGINECKKFRNYEYFITEKEGKKFAFIAFSEAEFSQPNYEGIGSSVIDPIDMNEKIKKLKKQSDYIFVVLYGGYEHFPLPFPEFRKTCRFLVDLGVDSFICNHIHVYGPIEIYKQKPIIYSTGNFYFPSKNNIPGWNEGYAALIKVDTFSNDIGLEIIPSHYESNIRKLKKLDSESKNIFDMKLNKLNNIIQSEKLLNIY